MCHRTFIALALLLELSTMQPVTARATGSRCCHDRGADSHALASTSPGLTSTVVQGGIRLTLILPGRIYPRNALVPVRLTVWNVSAHNLELGTHGCDGKNLWADVLNRHGRVIDPPLSAYALGSCAPPPPRFLAPGTQLSAVWMAVLRAGTIVGRTALEGGGRSLVVTTPSLHSALGPARQPSWRLVRSPRLSLVVRSRGASGPLYYRDSGGCGNGGWLSRSWHVAIGDRVESQMCLHPDRWYVEAGYAGQSVVTVSYVKR